MKKIFFILLTLFAIAPSAKADTIDVWHVYSNKIKIREFTQYGSNEIHLRLDSIQNGDSITVKYFRDTPCSDCFTYLSVEDGKHRVLLKSKGQGSFNPISFSLKDLMAIKKLNGKDSFSIFYLEGDIKSRSDKILVFKIKLE